MQQLFKTLAICLLAVGLQAQSSLQYIPGDASFNLSMRPASLDAKIDFDALKQLEIFQMATQGLLGQMGPGSEMESLLSDPSSAGIDILQESYLFGSFLPDRKLFGYIFALSDAGKFETLLNQMMGGEMPVEQKDGYRYFSFGSEGMLAWNQEVVLIAGVDMSYQAPYDDYGWMEEEPMEWEAEEPGEWIEEEPIEIEEVPEMVEEVMPPPPPPIEEEDQIMEEPYYEEEELEIAPGEGEDLYFPYPPMEQDLSYEQFQEEKAAAVADWVDMVMNRSFDQPLSAQSQFRKAAAKPADMHFWADYAGLMSMNYETGLAGMGATAAIMPMMLAMYEDTYLSAGLNFNKGEARLDVDLFSNERLLNIWRKSLDAKFNKKIAKYIPGDDLLGYFNVQYNIENTMEGMRELMEPMLEGIPMYGEAGLALLDVIGIAIDEDDLYNLFKGDLTLAVTGMQEVEKTITTYEYDENFNAQEVEKTVKQTIPEVVMMMSYGSQENINRLIKLGTASTFLVPAGKYYQLAIPDLPMDLYLAMADDILFLTNNADLVENRLGTGYAKNERISKAHCQRLKKNASVLFWDIPKSMDAALAFGLPLGGGEGMFYGVQQELENMMIVAPKEVKESVSSSFSFSINDKETNFLEKVFQVANDMMMSQMGGSKS